MAPTRIISVSSSGREQSRQSELAAGGNAVTTWVRKSPKKPPVRAPMIKVLMPQRVISPNRLPVVPLGAYFLHDEESRQEHQQAVAHIRHHDTVEQDEKRRHQGVGVHIVVGGEGVHLRHHVQRLGEPVVFQLHRHIGDLLLRGIQRLPGAARFPSGTRLPPFLLRRDPALEVQHRLIRQQTLSAHCSLAASARSRSA